MAIRTRNSKARDGDDRGAVAAIELDLQREGLIGI